MGEHCIWFSIQDVTAWPYAPKGYDFAEGEMEGREIINRKDRKMERNRESRTKVRVR